MDSALEFLDNHLLDEIYMKLFPATIESNTTLTSLLTRDNDIRIFLSLFTFISLGAWSFYLSAASFSYYVLFDYEIMKHPKFLKNQIRLEIVCRLLTLPWIWGEVKGYSKLYEDSSLYGGWLYIIFSVCLFLLVTDFAIYCIHRCLHHPYIYKWVHKHHHKWIVPTPFASHAVHPLDGYLSSIPYHIFVYLIPMQIWCYIIMFIFVNFWTVAIHDGKFMLRSTIINSSAHHALHHLNFNCNYGQYFTLWDRLLGSHRQPSEEQYNDVIRNSKEVWAKQAYYVDSIENQSTKKKVF